MTLPTGRQDIARHFYDLGFNILPLDRKEKRPLVKWVSGPKNFTEERQTLADLESMPWQIAGGIAAIVGPVSGGLVCIDFDKQEDRAAVNSILADLDLPPNYNWLVETPGQGYHLWIISPNFPLNGQGKLDRDGINSGHIELRYAGMMTTLPPSLHPNGGRYAFANGDPTGPPSLVDPEKVIAAYERVTIAPAPKPKPAPRPAYTGDIAHTENYESWCLEVEYVAIAQWHIPERRASSEWSKKNFRSPLREDRKASASWDYARHGLKDFGGEYHNTQAVAALLGLPSWEDHKADHRPAPAVKIDSTRFAKGMAYTVSKKLLNAHQRYKEMPNQGAAALTLFVWQELANMLPDDQPFTVKEFVKGSKAIGRNVTRKTIEKGLSQLSEWGVLEVLIPYYLKERNVDRLQNFQNLPDQGGRPAKTYQFKPVSEALTAFVKRIFHLERLRAYADALDNPQADYPGNLTAEELARWDESLKPDYAREETRRKIARAQFTGRTEKASNDIAPILRGTNRIVSLPPGPLPNPNAYRVAIWFDPLKEGKERPNANAQQWEVGVKSGTLNRWRKKHHVIAVRESRTIAACEFDEKKHRKIKDLPGGKIEIHAPSREILVTHASEKDIAANLEFSEKQSRLASLRKSPYDPFCGDDVANRKDAIHELNRFKKDTPTPVHMTDQEAQAAPPVATQELYPDEYMRGQFERMSFYKKIPNRSEKSIPELAKILATQELLTAPVASEAPEYSDAPQAQATEFVEFLEAKSYPSTPVSGVMGGQQRGHDRVTPDGLQAPQCAQATQHKQAPENPPEPAHNLPEYQCDVCGEDVPEDNTIRITGEAFCLEHWPDRYTRPDKQYRPPLRAPKLAPAYAAG